MSCKTVCHSPETRGTNEHVRSKSVRISDKTNLEDNFFTHPWPEHVVSPKPCCPLLDVLHHGLGIGVYCLLSDRQAHVGVDSIFGWVWEQGNSVPVETRAANKTLLVTIGSFSIQ